jgi:hypothetical protein
MRFVSLVVLALGLAACDRPTEEACQAAMDNMHKVYGTKQPDPQETQSAIRRCRANSTTKTVACFTKAPDIQAFEACGSLAEKK